MNFNMGEKKGRRQAGLEAWSRKLPREVANNAHHEGQMSESFIGVPQNLTKINIHFGPVGIIIFIISATATMIVLSSFLT